ncbi:acyltransferase [Flavobacterium sp. ZB4P13]|uniref:acyltransferase n=1 Tax=Flavobacterium sp. ZB4P13 TaxID=3401728 RepID=UPI003AAA5733
MNEPLIFNSQIKSDVIFGTGVKVVNPVNLYGCTIGNNTFVGPFVEIQKDVKIGDNCKIQSHTFICELVEIGDNCFVGHGVVFINDLFTNGKPAMGDKSLWKKTKVGNNVSIGSNATILPVEICDDVVIGAGAVVTKNIIKPGVYIGNPAKLLKNSN